MTPTLASAGPAPERPPGPGNLGFLSIVHEPTGYLGGYLATNVWGRPLEFRLSSAVQPNRVQQILYAGTLQGYVCADLIGKTLVSKSTTPVQLVVTDCEAALDLRFKVEVPVAWLAPPDRLNAPGPRFQHGGPGRAALVCHPRFAGDVAVIRELLSHVDSAFDLAEPFVRVREAIAEARKMGPGRQ